MSKCSLEVSSCCAPWPQLACSHQWFHGWLQLFLDYSRVVFGAEGKTRLTRLWICELSWKARGLVLMERGWTHTSTGQKRTHTPTHRQNAHIKQHSKIAHDTRRWNIVFTFLVHFSFLSLSMSSYNNIILPDLVTVHFGKGIQVHALPSQQMTNQSNSHGGIICLTSIRQVSWVDLTWEKERKMSKDNIINCFHISWANTVTLSLLTNVVVEVKNSLFLVKTYCTYSRRKVNVLMCVHLLQRYFFPVRICA